MHAGLCLHTQGAVVCGYLLKINQRLCASMHNIQRICVFHITTMAATERTSHLAVQAALSQVMAAAASCCSLEQLDLSSTGLTDAALKPLAQATGSSWISRGAAAGCRGLRRLAIGGNCRLSAAAVGQLGRAMAAAGQLPGLVELSLAGCASVGDEGALVQAATSCVQAWWI